MTKPRRKQAKASSGAPGIRNGIGPALNPISVQRNNRYLDPHVALAEWRSELEVWFDDESRVEAFGQPVRKRRSGRSAP